MMLAILICGWTGLVLVWDQQAQVLAIEGARLFDALPIFSEPIGRAFVSEKALPESFFFLNLFLHVALPLGIVALLIIHVIRLQKPLWFPKKALLWRLSLTFSIFSIMWPASLNNAANLFVLPEAIKIDWFYAFWLPFANAIPPRVQWMLWMLFVMIMLTTPLWWKPKHARTENQMDSGS